MEREIEPELMETKEQVISYANADFSVGENLFIAFINDYLKIHKIKLKSGDLIVDLGCGPGNISEKISLNWPFVKVLGIDGSKEMINKAKIKRDKYKNKEIFNNLNYLVEDVKKINLRNISINSKIKLLVSNSLIHHITHIDEFLNSICKLSTKHTINFHKDLKRPLNKAFALELKSKCSKKYNKILTNDYFASLKASYRPNELEERILKKKLSGLKVIEDGEDYLIVYGKVYN